MMIDAGTFYESVDIQHRFIRQLTEVGRDPISELVRLLTGFFLEDRGSTKFVYGIAEGRSALALYDFLQQSSRYENIMPLTLDDPIRRYVDPERRNLIIAASGSGETKSVIRYLEDAFKLDVPVVLFTAKVGSKAYDMVTEYPNGYVFVVPRLTGWDRKNLAALGSEFELKLIVMLNALIPELYIHDRSNVDRYYAQVDHFAANASLLKNIEAEHVGDWTDKLLNRRGNYIVDGVGRSGFVAKAFGMRLTHLGQHVFMRDGPTTPAFLRGDAYIPLSGSGNTREIVEGVVKAKLRGADVFPILVNVDSRLSSLMDSWGYAKNVMYIPVSLEDIGFYWEQEMSKIVASRSV
ncbi:MAG TPA: sugar phosphate isomerase, partial [Methanocella sp.]|nr:sugar phosphate isomerase [Methanocella sp.]